jgi:formate dehydrogenase maturation protein FdhE
MSATPKVDKWAFDAMPGGPEVVSANCARELEELLMAAEDENEVLHKEIERLDEMVMRWFKAASPYATPGSLEEGLRKRALLSTDCHCPSCGHNRCKSSVSSIDNDDGTHYCQRCSAEWREI